MRIKAEAPSFRRGIMLDAAARARIEALRVNTEAGSDSDVIRMALIFFAELVEAKGLGHRIIVRDGDAHDDDFGFPVATEPVDANSAGLVKRNLVLHDRTANRLDALREATGLVSDSEMVRQAIGVYSLLVESALSGRSVILHNIPRRTEREVFVPVSRKNSRLKTAFNLFHSIEI